MASQARSCNGAGLAFALSSIVALAGPLAGQELQLVMSGSCPGELILTVASASPDSPVAIFGGSIGGTTSLPEGPCAGITLDLLEPRPIVRVSTDSEGTYATTLEVPAEICGLFIQAVDLATCGTTGVAPLASGEPGPVPRTGQTRVLFPGDDGDWQSGFASPRPRFIDNGDGTVTDHLTGLLWLRRVDCYELRTWEEAVATASALAAGACGLTDGSSPGEWRLPNVRELASLIDYSEVRPSLPADHPFIGVIEAGEYYWTSTSVDLAAPEAWGVLFSVGHIDTLLKDRLEGVWPVRSGRPATSRRLPTSPKWPH